MNWQPDRAVMLSLPASTDRRTYMSAMLKRLSFPVETVDALDGNTMAIPPSWQSSPEAYGNAMSHRMVLAQQTSGSLLVLEDDAFIRGDFNARLSTVLAAAPEWDVIMLGGEMRRRPLGVAAGVLRCPSVGRSIGYLVQGKGIASAITAIDRSTDHWDNRFAQAMPTLNVFAPDPFIVSPNGLPSTIPDSTPYQISRRTSRN